MNTLKSKLAILVLLLSIAFPVFAQDATEVPTVEVAVEAEPDVTVDSSIMILLTTGFSILAVTIVSGIAVFRSGGTAQEAIKAGAEKGVRSLIGNEGLSSTVENRLLAIPQAQRNWLMELVNLASPLTDTSTISTDAAQWIVNVLDGNLETGAIVAQSTRDTMTTIQDKPDTTETVG
jgi:regulator of protease activity HflC (stomatin/prohibitin superfamily)